jgi:hypothetical protein
MTNQAAIIALFRIINRYVGNPAPMPDALPRFPTRAISMVAIAHRFISWFE